MAFDSIGNLKFMFLMVNLKFLESNAGKKTEFCLCIVSTVQWEKKTHLCSGNLSPCFGIFVWFLWCLILVGQFLGFSWNFYGIFMGLLWCSILVGPIFGIFMGFVWDFYGNCCGILWDCYASGWPKTTEQIVELPWLQSKIVFFSFILIDYCLNGFCCHLVFLMD